MTWTGIATDASLALLGAAALLTLVRVARGPTTADRVVALDTLTVVAMGIIAVVSVLAALPVTLDVAIILGIVAFLGTIGYAYSLGERRDV